MSLIKFTKEEFIRLDSEARFDFHRWEVINKAKKEKQCFNTIRGCRVGVFCEYAIQKHLINKYREGLISLNCYGRKERLKSIHFRSKPDIEIEFYDKDRKQNKEVFKHYKIEIKGISEGQPKGQILTYHADKYSKNEFTHVAFCELFFNEEKKEASVEIYLIDQIKNIKNYPIAKNKFSKDCYTNPKYLHMVKSHK